MISATLPKINGASSAHATAYVCAEPYLPSSRPSYFLPHETCCKVDGLRRMDVPNNTGRFKDVFSDEEVGMNEASGNTAPGPRSRLPRMEM